MKSIKIVIKNKKLGRVVPSGNIQHNTLRRAVGESWTSYYSSTKDITLDKFVDYHNERSHIQIEDLQTEVITLD